MAPREQKIFRDGMRNVDEAMQKAHNVSFMAATPEQRLAVLTVLDHEQKRVMDEREAAQRQGGAKQPAHYFRMMKELALLGFFTSEDRLHQGAALCGGAGPLRSLHSLHAGRARLGGARLTV